MRVHYRAVTPFDQPTVAELIAKLYEEDPAEEPMSAAKIQRTFDELRAHPDLGSIIVLEREDRIIGYSILINFWSNEFGGNLLTIDELYVAAEFRGQGIASDFVRHLVETARTNAVAVQLEVTPNNKRARKLYESLGFTSRKNATLLLKLPPIR